MLTREMLASSRLQLLLYSGWTPRSSSTKNFGSVILSTSLKSTSVMIRPAFMTQFLSCTIAGEQRWKDLPLRSRCLEIIQSFISSVICSLICFPVILIREVHRSVSVAYCLYTVLLASSSSSSSSSSSCSYTVTCYVEIEKYLSEIEYVVCAVCKIYCDSLVTVVPLTLMSISEICSASLKFQVVEKTAKTPADELLVSGEIT